MNEFDPMIEGHTPDRSVLVKFVGDHVARVTLNRPTARNAVDGAMARQLEAAVRQTEADPDIRAVVLVGSGRGFCAGADLVEFAAGRHAALWTDHGGFAGFVNHTRRKPWIAAVHGFALAGGLEIALACDLIVSSDDARFGLPEVKRGLVAGAGGLFRLPRKMPANFAAECILTGETFDAGRAHAMGLTCRVASASELQEVAMDLARKIALNAPLAVAESLRVLRLAGELTEPELQAISDESLNLMVASDDMREGTRAFVEKRAPRWTGR